MYLVTVTLLYAGDHYTYNRAKDEGIQSILCIKINNWLDPHKAALVAQLVKNPPTMQETWVRSLGQENPLEKENSTTV